MYHKILFKVSAQMLMNFKYIFLIFTVSHMYSACKQACYLKHIAKEKKSVMTQTTLVMHRATRKKHGKMSTVGYDSNVSHATKPNM